jgi:hypothetical protein
VPRWWTWRRDDDLWLAEASYVDDVPEDSQRCLTSARDAGRRARSVGTSRP